MTKQMTAMVVRDFGGIEQLVPATVPVPEPGPGNVRITMHAAGVNFPDALMVAGEYQLRPELPFSPGFEVAGVVSAVGEGVTGLAVGDRVAATPWYGAYAEEVVVDAAVCEPLPDTLPFEDAAVLPIAFGTALHALRDRGRLTAGETLLVAGATGGTGSAAVKIGKLLGATVIAAVGSDAKRDLAGAMGADRVVTYGGDSPLRDQVKDLTGGAGADVIFDPVGGDVTLEALRCVGWDGRILVVGFTSGIIADVPANLMLLKGASLVGVFWGRWRTLDPDGAHAQFTELADWATSGELDPGISERHQLTEAVEALRTVTERRAVGKIVLTR